MEKDDACVNFKLFEDYTDDDGNAAVRTKCVNECPEGTWERTFKPKNDKNMEFKICERCPDGCKRCDLGHFNKVYLWDDNEAPFEWNDHVRRTKDY